MKEEYLYNREYEADECSYNITVRTTDHGAYQIIKDYAEEVLSKREFDARLVKRDETNE